jgi:hypothetical protein
VDREKPFWYHPRLKFSDPEPRLCRSSSATTKRARERAEAVRRYRKLQRKRMQREGLLPR